jgi:2-polyprenyl-3-methyl-5-hydroxy-6-metoxy-1,4-benzoquinol methylase
MPGSKTQNINDIYFDGLYKEVWRSFIPEDLTVKEIDFMLDYFKLKPGDKVLDLMCGYGRHAIGLGRKGISVTAVDNLDDYIHEINQVVREENLPVSAVCENVIEFKTSETFDLAICMGNSLNFFDVNDTLKLLSNTSSNLKTGGSLLINTWSLAEIVIKSFRDKSWSRFGDNIFLSDSKYLFHPARVETDSMIIAPDGTVESKKAIDYVFSVNEMEVMLNQAGFELKEIYSIPGRKKFTAGEPRAYIVGEKKN